MGNAGLIVFRPSLLSSLHLVALVLVMAINVLALSTNFINFETAPVHPLDLGPAGRTLALCNLPDNRVELFDVSSGVPVPLGNVTVGLDPVSVRFASSNELWVVNHISSTISIVDVAARRVVATLDTLAGPSDLVFAGNPRRAWISCSRTNAILVINPQTRLAVTNIAIDGERPRAMATSPDGSKVYVAIFESGNSTTVLGRRLTGLGTPAQPGPVDDPNGPYAGRNPPPNSGTNFVPAIKITNTPPPVSLIVRKNAAGRWMDDNHGDWTDWVSGTNAHSSGRSPGWDFPDRDVAIIDTSSLSVNYVHRLMNICMAIGVNPLSGEIAVVGTDATNERRFEPVLNGIFLRVNIALVDPLSRTSRLRDLNPHLDYITRTLPQEQRARSIGDPRGIEWNSAGTRAYVTGMGSRNLVILDANGNRLNSQPIELGEGPTGMALDESRARLYIWNRFSSSISVLNTTTATVITNVPVFDPTPEVIRKGRRHLYDTRKSSGLGIASCASCHVDARMDRLAWDLGDPAGNMATNARSGFTFHPMKGPMVTQTFQDIITPFLGSPPAEQSLHWRGDRNNFEEFNSTFTNLQANDVELTTNEMAEFKGMLATIFFPPNFLRTLPDFPPELVHLPGQFGGPLTNGGPRSPLPPGRPSHGELIFDIRRGQACIFCHFTDRGGRAPNTDDEFGAFPTRRTEHESAFKVSQLRSLLDKVGMDGGSTNSRSGFGFMHDGRVDTLSTFLVDGFGLAPTNHQQIADAIAFLFTFRSRHGVSQELPAAVGRQVTFDSPSPPPPVGFTLENIHSVALDPFSGVQLVVRGKKNGRPRSWLLRVHLPDFTSDFQSDRGEIAPTFEDVIAPAAPGNEFTAMLVPEGSGVRIGLDRDGDGFFDMSEVESGFDPADAASHPGPSRIVSISKASPDNRQPRILTWESVPGVAYSLQVRFSLSSTNSSDGIWYTLGSPIIAESALTTYTNTSYTPPSGDLSGFYRVRTQP
jgi:YVTN family beta-propeller protein